MTDVSSQSTKQAERYLSNSSQPGLHGEALSQTTATIQFRGSWVQCNKPVVPEALDTEAGESFGVKASLVYITRPYLKNPEQYLRH